MAENLDPPRIAGCHFFVDLKIVYFGRKRSSNSTTEAAVHTVLDDAHSRRIRTWLSLHLRVMYWLLFTAVRVAQDGAPDCAQRRCGARSCAHHPVRRARRFGLT